MPDFFAASGAPPWLEEIEELSKTQIFENRSKWFETELDKHDIENSMTSPYKMYKSGKMYIIRANVPNTLGKSELKIYDENESDVDMDSIQENTSLITILEVQGVRCSTKNFQIDIELKQIMVMKPVNLFEKCIHKYTCWAKLVRLSDIENLKSTAFYE